MSIVEVQIRTDRFCELVRSELNSRGLSSPTLDFPDELKGKFLERIECVSCSLDEPSEGSGTFKLNARLAFKYHTDLQKIRAAGSLRPAATAESLFDFKLKFTIAFDPSLPQPPRLTYELLAYGLLRVDNGFFPLNLSDDLQARSAAIEESPARGTHARTWMERSSRRLRCGGYTGRLNSQGQRRWIGCPGEWGIGGFVGASMALRG